LVKEFLAYAIFTTILILAVGGHYLFNKNDINEQNLKIAQLTRITEPSFSVSSLESRLPHLDKSQESSVYPDMLTTDRLGFVYAK